jgi:hypothetical protein
VVGWKWLSLCASSIIQGEEGSETPRQSRLKQNNWRSNIITLHVKLPALMVECGTADRTSTFILFSRTKMETSASYLTFRRICCTYIYWSDKQPAISRLLLEIFRQKAIISRLWHFRNSDETEVRSWDVYSRKFPGTAMRYYVNHRLKVSVGNAVKYIVWIYRFRKFLGKIMYVKSERQLIVVTLLEMELLIITRWVRSSFRVAFCVLQQLSCFGRTNSLHTTHRDLN